jgi:hypothetical protein
VDRGFGWAIRVAPWFDWNEAQRTPCLPITRRLRKVNQIASLSTGGREREKGEKVGAYLGEDFVTLGRAGVVLGQANGRLLLRGLD